MLRLVLLLIAVNFTPSSACPDATLAVIEDKEAFVVRLAEEAAALFRRRGKLETACECSIHVCRTGFSQHACHLVQRRLAAICGGRHCITDIKGATTFVETPPTMDSGAVSHEMKENVCLYKSLETTLTQLMPMPTTTTRISTKDGHSRVYPGEAHRKVLQKQDQLIGDACRAVDPRREAYYVDASVGARDVVLVIDASMEMAKPMSVDSNVSRLATVNEAVRSVMDAFSSNDRVNVVAFSDRARRRGIGRSLFRGSDENIYVLKRSIGALHPFGKSNVRSGIKLAFDLLIDSNSKRKRLGRFHRGQKAILIISGSDDRGDRSEKLLRLIDRRQQKLSSIVGSKAKIFTYSIGEIDNALLKQIACANDGAWFSIGPQDDAFSVLNRYNTFLASTHHATRPIWTNFKFDPYLKTQITTVSKAFHLPPRNGQNALLLGVVSHEVRLEDLQFDGISQRKIERELNRRSRKHDALDVRVCQLQVYRNVYANGSICVDSLPTKTDQTTKIHSNANQNPPCFAFNSRFYKAFSRRVTRQRAHELCQSDGGKLARVKSDDSLAFLAGMASADGSWVNPKRTGDDSVSDWEDETSPAPRFPEIQIQQESNFTDACVRIDNRGPTENLQVVKCRKRLSYICVYKSQKDCSSVISLPKRGYFSLPPLDLCIQEEESLANAAALSAATVLPSSHLWCSLDHGTRDLQSMCCKDCPLNEDALGSTEAEDLTEDIDEI